MLDIFLMMIVMIWEVDWDVLVHWDDLVDWDVDFDFDFVIER